MYKKVRVVSLMLDKIDFRMRNVVRDKEVDFIIIKVLKC